MDKGRMQNAEFPWWCGVCGKQVMIDLTCLEQRELDRLVSMDGFVCGCGGWTAVMYWTESLRVAMNRLEQMDVGRRDYRYHFGKVMRKAEGVREKAESGVREGRRQNTE